jgi:Predicted membrane protein
MTEPGPQPTLRPTGWQTIGVAVVVGAGLGWLLFSLLDLFDLPLPQLPLAVVGTTAVLAVFTAIQAWATHRTVQVRHEQLEPQRAVRLVVLGKASLLVGAALAGGYAAIAGYSVSRWDAVLPRERVISSVVAVIAGVGLAVAGVFLERACRIPPSADDDATPPRNPDHADDAG